MEQNEHMEVNYSEKKKDKSKSSIPLNVASQGQEPRTGDLPGQTMPRSKHIHQGFLGK